MFARHPQIAKRWASETEDIKSLPEKVKPMKKSAAGRFFRDLDGRDDGMFMGKLAQGAAAASSGMADTGKPSQPATESSKLDIGVTGAPMGGTGFRGQGMGGGLYGTGSGKTASAAPSDWDTENGMPTGFHRPAREQPEGLEDGGERFHSTESNSVASPSNRQRHGLVEGGSMTLRATSSPQMGKHASIPRFLGTSYGIEKSAWDSDPTYYRKAPKESSSSGDWVSSRAGEYTSSLGRAARGIGETASSAVKAVTTSPVGATLATLIAAKMGIGGIKRLARGARASRPAAKQLARATGHGGLVGKLMSGARDVVSGARNFVTK